MDSEFTRKFQVVQDRNEEMRATLMAVYDALKEKGYNPINQIVGYILSEDPTYITNYNNARTLIRKLDRDELLGVGSSIFDQLTRVIGENVPCCLKATGDVFVGDVVEKEDILQAACSAFVLQ